jgi:hypothetical protein
VQALGEDAPGAAEAIGAESKHPRGRRDQDPGPCETLTAKTPTSPTITRILDVRDTRDRIEVGDRWVPVPGSGHLRPCRVEDLTDRLKKINRKRKLAAMMF